MNTPGIDAARERVRSRYATAAGQARSGLRPSCSEEDPTGTCGSAYLPEQLAEVADTVSVTSLGCGNPLAVADLAAGDSVLDLGSGAGLDVLLSARRVGPTGQVYGLDMTDEMLDLARQHAAEADASNVEFLHGHIEAIPLPTASVDVVISNCVINLSADKPAVFAEIVRVLRPGGRLGVSDLVADDHTDPAVLTEAADSVGAVAGVLRAHDYRAELERTGLDAITITPTARVATGVDAAIIQAARP